MRKFCLSIVAAMVLAACGESTAPANEFSALLGGGQEVPPVTTAATGTATFEVNGANLDYTVAWTGLSGNATFSHIHIGALGATGGVRLNLCGTGGAVPACPTGTSATVTGTATPAFLAGGITMDSLLSAMRQFNAYANVHTAANAGGEIRGQIITH